MAVILQKMIMTGAMCVVAPGSSVQLLIAILVMFMYTLLVLKTAPYEKDSEDWSSFIACVALTLTTIGGFALVKDDGGTYESSILAVILISLNVVSIALNIIIILIFDCGIYERISGTCRSSRTDEGVKKKITQVAPVRSMNDATKEAARKAWQVNDQ